MGNSIQPKTIGIILVIYVALIVVMSYFVYLLLDDLDQTLALGQLFLEILLLPTVIIGFIITIEEFRRAQAIPRLELYWEIELDNSPYAVRDLTKNRDERNNSLFSRPG